MLKSIKGHLKLVLLLSLVLLISFGLTACDNGNGIGIGDGDVNEEAVLDITEIEVDKEKYYVGEEVGVTATIENKGNIEGSFIPAARIMITDTTSRTGGSPGNTINLQPGETYEFNYYVLITEDYFGEGTYDVRVSLWNDYDDDTSLATRYLEEAFTAVEYENDRVITFEDENLEDAVRERINKPEGDLYLSNVKFLKHFNASEKGIENLDGIKYFENLEWLGIWANELTDISPIANLEKLDGLNFHSNNVSDIGPLENLTGLEFINMGDNNISDLSPISNLENLELLGLWDNEIKDISLLSDLTNLHEIYFNINKVEDISPLVDNEGFGTGDIIDMRYNNLDLTEGSEDMENINTLIERGVEVEYDPQN